MAALSFAQSGYRIGEDSASADAGPVRMARFGQLKGSAEWRATSNLGWSAAATNLPIREGAQIYAPNSTKSEVQFDDGADMRLTDGAVATLVTMYSDAKGEFTEIKLSNGLATFHLVNKNSLYQIDTPTGSIKSYGPAVIRVGDTSGVEIAVRKGEAELEAPQCKCSLKTGQYVDLRTDQAQPVVRSIPSPDAWDNYNENRDQVVYSNPQYVPPNIGVTAGDLQGQGDWQDDAQYGHVWYPHESSKWQPYHEGHWVFADPYGWTWVGDESWGWAPYHYGTWIHGGHGWGWCPGPARQCWSPAVVDFSVNSGDVGWCPLAPGDVNYSAVSVGFGAGDFLLSFSVGRAGCYYPVSGGYCEARPWSNVYVNRGVNLYTVNNINRYYGDPGLRAAWGNRNFVPRNARFGGGSFVAQNNFGRGGARFASLPGSRSNFFQKGQGFGMPTGRAGQISGPLSVRPNTNSFTARGNFGGHGPSAALLNRQVYRSAVPKYASRQSEGIGRNIAPPARSRNLNIGRAAAIGAGVGAAGLAAHAAANHFAHSNPAAHARPAAGSFGNHGGANNNAAARAAAARNSAARLHGNAGNHTAVNRAALAHAAGNRAAGNRGAGNRAAANRVAGNRNGANRNAGNRAANHRATAVNHTATRRPSVGTRVRTAAHHAATAVRNRASSVRHSIQRRMPTRRSVSRPVERRAPVRQSTPRRSAPRSFSRPSAPRNYSRPQQQRSAPRNFSRPPQQRSNPRPSFGGGGGGGRRGGGGGGGGGRRRGH